MAKPITQFQAEDGSIHATMDAAMQHDRRLVELAAVMSSMPPVKQEGCEFTNGGGYKDWPTHLVREARNGIMRLLRAWRPSLFDGDTDPSLWYVGRFLSDGDTNPSLYGAFMRLFFCIDHAGREYGQPYYRNHPEQCGKRAFK